MIYLPVFGKYDICYAYDIRFADDICPWQMYCGEGEGRSRGMKFASRMKSARADEIHGYAVNEICLRQVAFWRRRGLLIHRKRSLTAARSRSGSDRPPEGHSPPSRRFATFPYKGRRDTSSVRNTHHQQSWSPSP